jgi:hypothetical protein
MYIFLEYAACLILVVSGATLLFAVCALLIILKEEATEWGRLARGIAQVARILLARQTDLIRGGLSSVGFGLGLKEEEVRQAVFNVPDVKRGVNKAAGSQDNDCEGARIDGRTAAVQRLSGRSLCLRLAELFCSWTTILPSETFLPGTWRKRVSKHSRPRTESTHW